MENYPHPYLYMAATSGFFWTITYILIIKRGFQDKAHGMPMWALAMNISWEFIYSFVTPAPAPQLYINIVWFSFDVVILYHFIKSWKLDFPQFQARYFYPFFALVMVTSFLGVLFIQYDGLHPGVMNLEASKGYALGMGRAYSAFGMNMIMSILYVGMIMSRNSVAGQSIYIALAKMIGTIFADLAFIVYPKSPITPGTPHADELLFPYMYAAILIFDIIYVVLVYRKCKEEGINPWRRA
ncbi:MAG: hypothetical protein CVV44_17650 [Spirochaetae bacterium HGW-Spirochaetae-1]|jgi:hypothetical protein|nr:MAG: hypothetical protein CVV44_17650 [Spirochaetae bacterium HGW-Spirochaetae-1]